MFHVGFDPEVNSPILEVRARREAYLFPDESHNFLPGLNAVPPGKGKDIITTKFNLKKIADTLNQHGMACGLSEDAGG